jgi:hypothetical protein
MNFVGGDRINRKFYFLLLPLCCLLIITLLGCKIKPDSSAPEQVEKGSWAIYTPYDWIHDGKPYQSLYCSIYSDSASETMKKQMAEIADESFNLILQSFNFQNISDFIYPPGSNKIEIYLNINHAENINWAYWGGFIITIRSSNISGHWLDYTQYTASHELIHVFEFLIEGREILGSAEWFKEGIAVHVGCLNSSAFKTVKNLNELESWILMNQDIPGKGNPIRINLQSDFPDGADRHQYYRFFELAVRYLLDPKGYGRSFQDVLNLFYDLRQEIPFSVSFETHLGISLGDYENGFFDRMRAYLSNNHERALSQAGIRGKLYQNELRIGV